MTVTQTDETTAEAYRRGLTAHREVCELCTPRVRCAQATRMESAIAELTGLEQLTADERGITVLDDLATELANRSPLAPLLTPDATDKLLAVATQPDPIEPAARQRAALYLARARADRHGTAYRTFSAAADRAARAVCRELLRDDDDTLGLMAELVAYQLLDTEAALTINRTTTWLNGDKK